MVWGSNLSSLSRLHRVGTTSTIRDDRWGLISIWVHVCLTDKCVRATTLVYAGIGYLADSLPLSIHIGYFTCFYLFLFRFKASMYLNQCVCAFMPTLYIALHAFMIIERLDLSNWTIDDANKCLFYLPHIMNMLDILLLLATRLHIWNCLEQQPARSTLCYWSTLLSLVNYRLNWLACHPPRSPPSGLVPSQSPERARDLLCTVSPQRWTAVSSPAARDIAPFLALTPASIRLCLFPFSLTRKAK